MQSGLAVRKVRDSPKVSAKVQESHVSRPHTSRAAPLRLGLESKIFPKVFPDTNTHSAMFCLSIGAYWMCLRVYCGVSILRGGSIWEAVSGHTVVFSCFGLSFGCISIVP